MTIKAIEGAIKAWENPEKMIHQWDESESKAEQDRLVAQMVGIARRVADLGCGAGHLVPLLYYVEEYHGYDFSPKMLEAAVERCKEFLFAKFFQCDVFAEASGELFDVAVLYDVAVHQENPIAAVRQVLNTWIAKRYVCTLLVGPTRKQLYATMVVSTDEFERFLCDKLRLGWTVRYHRQLLEGGFDWVVLDISR